jgi:hypothetical protein
MVLLGLSFLAILRYLSIEIGDNTMKFFGGAALIGLILFRNVFRFTRRRYILINVMEFLLPIQELHLFE